MLRIIFVALFFLPFTTPAQSKAEPETEVPTSMYQFLNHVLTLQPFMVSEDGFKKLENRQLIRTNLQQMNELSKSLHQEKRLDTTSFHISAAVLERHLQEAFRSFEAGRFSYARRMLAESLHGCSSCHVQVSGESKINWEFAEDRVQGSDFEKADFFYSIRNYQKALELYQSMSIGFPRSNLSPLQLETAVNRALSIFLRVQRDSDQASRFLARLSSHRRLPKALLDSVRVWRAELAQVSKLQRPAVATMSADELIQFISSHLSEEQIRQRTEDKGLVWALYLSGVLYEFANSRPESAMNGSILYWMSLLDEKLEGTFLHDLSDLYLRECILRYSRQPIARRCYDRMEEKVKLSYTGSAGEELPPEVKQDLDQLKSRIMN